MYVLNCLYGYGHPSIVILNLGPSPLIYLGDGLVWGGCEGGRHCPPFEGDQTARGTRAQGGIEPLGRQAPTGFEAPRPPPGRVMHA